MLHSEDTCEQSLASIGQTFAIGYNARSDKSGEGTNVDLIDSIRRVQIHIQLAYILLGRSNPSENELMAMPYSVNALKVLEKQRKYIKLSNQCKRLLCMYEKWWLTAFHTSGKDIVCSLFRDMRENHFNCAHTPQKTLHKLVNLNLGSLYTRSSTANVYQVTFLSSNRETAQSPTTLSFGNRFIPMRRSPKEQQGSRHSFDDTNVVDGFIHAMQEANEARHSRGAARATMVNASRAGTLALIETRYEVLEQLTCMCAKRRLSPNETQLAMGKENESLCLTPSSVEPASARCVSRFQVTHEWNLIPNTDNDIDHLPPTSPYRKATKFFMKFTRTKQTPNKHKERLKGIRAHQSASDIISENSYDALSSASLTMRRQNSLGDTLQHTVSRTVHAA